jgi:cysteine-S-conjugate beta-lyase
MWRSYDQQMDPMLGDCSLERLRRRTSYKWRTHEPDVLPAFVAEMDFEPAREIKDAIVAALDTGGWGYAHAGGLGEAFAEFAADRFGWSPDPGLVFAIPDVITGITEIISAITGPGAGVVINPPVYAPFFFRIEMIGRRIVEAPLRAGPDGGYDLDPAALDAALAQPGVGAYLLCNPHNPLGRVWARDQLVEVAEICARRDIPVLVDEIHAPLVLPGARHVPFHTIDHSAAREAFVFSSASKGWNIPGLKCGLAIAAAPRAADVLRDRWDALLASHLGELASEAAFRGARPWLDAAVAQIDANAGRLRALLAEQLPGVGYRKPEASFLAWLDCRQLGAGDNPAEVFLDRGRVALSPGPDFGTQGTGFARLNMGTSPELLDEAVRRIAAAVRG